MNYSRAAFRLPPKMRGILVFAIAAAVAFYAGFLRFSPHDCDRLVRGGAYLWMLALSAGFTAAIAGVFREEGGWRHIAGRLSPGWRQGMLITAVWLWLLHIDPPGYKILFDEPVQMSTALTLHTDREFATTTRAFRVDSVFTVLKAYLDKRPPLFPFFVATVHDLTGYRVANAYAVNAAATLLLVYLVWYLGRRYGKSASGGAFAVGLLATLPILGITATSAGMDLVNLVGIAALWIAVLAFLARMSEARAALLVTTSALLAYCRYESALYVGVALVAAALAMWRTRSWKLATVWTLLPLSLVLYAWHNTVLSHSPDLWELRPDVAQRFSLAYVANNLTHAGRFLFAVNWLLPNSCFIVATGLLGGAFIAVRVAMRRSALTFTEATAGLLIGAAVLASFALLMCYYWGELDDPIVSRLSLPLHLFLIITAVAAWREIQSSWTGLAVSWRLPYYATIAVLVAITLPAAARDRYTANNLMRKNFEWERRIAAQFWPSPDLVITNRSPICWLAEGVSAISLDRARLRLDELRWHLQHHSFSTVLVMQRVLTRGASGGWVVDSTDALPEQCELQEVAVRRIGVTLTRISRVVNILPTPKRDTPRSAASASSDL
jgi:hypothetical protein